MAIRVPNILSGRQARTYRRLERRQDALGQGSRSRQIEQRQRQMLRRASDANTPSVFARSNTPRLENQYQKLSRQAAIASARGQLPRMERLQGRLEGVKQRARDARIEVKDQKILEKQSRVRQDWLEQQGELAAQQQRQFNLLERNLQQQTNLIRGEMRRSTALEQEILEEQRRYQALLEQRALREQSVGQYQTSLLARQLEQEGVLSTGRMEAARARRSAAPMTSILFG